MPKGCGLAKTIQIHLTGISSHDESKTYKAMSEAASASTIAALVMVQSGLARDSRHWMMWSLQLKIDGSKTVAIKSFRFSRPSCVEGMRTAKSSSRDSMAKNSGARIQGWFICSERRLFD